MLRARRRGDRIGAHVRFAALGDQLRGKFDGQSFRGRLEASYRHAIAPMIGVTPYAALQAQGFHTPTYTESDLTRRRLRADLQFAQRVCGRRMAPHTRLVSAKFDSELASGAQTYAGAATLRYTW